MERGVDYELHHRDLVWIVNGNMGRAQVFDTPLSHILRVWPPWLYTSFKGLSRIFMEVDEFVYRIRPDDVKGGCIEVRNRVSRAQFVEALQTQTHDQLWDDAPLPHRQIYWKQRGAGNGKTYQSVRMIADPTFAGKDVFLYFAKVHSAREVIFDEFMAQAQSLGELGITIHPDRCAHRSNQGKAYNIPFERRDGTVGNVYIGTIDSFTYGMCGCIPRNSRDLFKDIVAQITDGNIRAADGIVTFKHNSIDLRTIIIVDEAQDLHPLYVTAMAAIMRETNADACLIGDKLQSVWGEDNAFTFLVKFTTGAADDVSLCDVHVNVDTGPNIVRRFHNPGLHARINSIVPFEKFGLEPIRHGCTEAGCRTCAEYNDPEPIKLGIKATDIAAVIRRIAKERCYVPSDFEIVTPLLKGRRALVDLETDIAKMWLDMESDVEYRQQVIECAWAAENPGKDWRSADHCWLHQSEDSRPIDLTASLYATRILSIHAAKGTGARVVFVVDLTEEKLRGFCNGRGPGTLQFESLLHVAVTRQKKSLYVAYTENPVQDDVYCRFHKVTKSEGLAPRPILIRRFVTTNYVASMLPDALREELSVEIDRMCDQVMEDMSPVAAKRHSVDDEQHDMRALVFRYSIIKNFATTSASPQLKALLYKICDIKAFPVYPVEAYRKSLNEFTEACKSRNPVQLTFPIQRLTSDDRDKDSMHAQCAKIMQSIVKSACCKVRQAWMVNRALPTLCPLEMQCFLHVIDIIKNGWSSTFRTTSISHVIKDYLLNGIPCAEAHADSVGCPCRSRITTVPDARRQRTGLAAFHDNVASHADRLLDKLRHTVGDMRDLLYNHKVKTESKYGACLTTHSCVGLAHGGKKVVVIHIMPTLSTLNLVDTVTRIVFDSTCFHAPCGHRTPQAGMMSNIERYAGKPQEHYVLTLDNTDPVPVKVDAINYGRTAYMFGHYVRHECSKFIGECVRLRDQDRSAYKLWRREVNNQSTLPIVKNIIDEVSDGGTIQDIEAMVDADHP